MANYSEALKEGKVIITNLLDMATQRGSLFPPVFSPPEYFCLVSVFCIVFQGKKKKQFFHSALERRSPHYQLLDEIIKQTRADSRHGSQWFSVCFFSFFSNTLGVCIFSIYTDVNVENQLALASSFPPSADELWHSRRFLNESEERRVFKRWNTKIIKLSTLKWTTESILLPNFPLTSKRIGHHDDSKVSSPLLHQMITP